jgi:hypothetical protein
MQLIYFEQEVNGGYELALQVISICAMLVQVVFILQLTASTNHHIYTATFVSKLSSY